MKGEALLMGMIGRKKMEAAKAEPLNGDASNVVPKEPAVLAPSSPSDWRARAG